MLKRTSNYVLSVVVVEFIVDAYEHHLVEKECISVWKQVGAGDGQRTSENEVLVKKG